MGILEKHKELKNKGYWNDLDRGNTTCYKERVMERLIRNHFPKTCNSIIDVGAGANCEHIFKYRDLLKAKKITCLDYDEKIIEKMKKKYRGIDINWHVADIFALENWNEQYDLVFLLDILHEIYSFYGRPNMDMNKQVGHKTGQEFVKRAVTNVVKNIKPRGILITDGPLSEGNNLLIVKLRSGKVKKAIEYFLEEYPTFDLKAKLNGYILEVREQSFCSLLSQYNKVKKEDWDRWNVEKMERHEYMTFSEYKEMFQNLRYEVHAVVETPEANLREWKEDFEILGGATELPPKRITLLAVK